MEHTNVKISDAGFKLLNIMPVMGFGTWNLRGKQCIESVADALNLGYRHIDTAQMYDNETEVGKGIKESEVERESIFVTTKLAPGALKPEIIKNKTEESLERLQLDYVDLLLIHWPFSGMDLKACLETMFLMQDDGLVRKVGVSNFSPELYKEALEIGPVFTNQLEFTPYQKEMDNLEVAKKSNNVITAYSPLDKGSVSKDKNLQQIGEKYNKTPAQVALRWLVQLGNVSVIPKAASREHRKENMDIFDFNLSNEDMETINSLN